MMKRWIPIALFIILILLPYIAAWGMQGEDRVFGGFLMNIADEYSYLAKMKQGWDGSWLFRLPFSAEQGEGVFGYLYYLGLGHLARSLNIPLILMYHFARVIGSAFMAWALLRFYRLTLPGMEEKMPQVLLMALLGGGMGWLLLPVGVMTSDYWVAEAYPFLSGYLNPHFTMALGLLICLLTDDGEEITLSRGVGLCLLGLALPTVLPFACVILGVLLLLQLGVNWRVNRRHLLARMIWIGVGAGPMLAYQLWVYQFDPVFRVWNAQNQTISPPLWDFLISFMPLLALAGVAAFRELKAKQASPARLLVIWLLTGLVMCYLPFSIQRRFIIGYMIPVAGLGMLGLLQLTTGRERHWRIVFGCVFAASLLTNVIGLTGAGLGIATHHPSLYMAKDEAAAYQWLDEHAPVNALVLAGPETGLRLPGWTGRRVIYGHPFETIHAEAEKTFVTAFFSDEMPLEKSRQVLAERGVDMIYYGPREKKLGTPDILLECEVVYQSGDVILYQVKQP